MNKNDFLKSGEGSFAYLCLEHFNFLESEFGLEFDGFAVANETVACYSSNGIRVQIVFSIPETPFVNIQKIEKGKIKNEYKYKPKDDRTRGSIRKFENHRDNNSFEDWFKDLRSGKLNEILEEIISGLAENIKPYLIDPIQNNNFSDLF